MRLLVASIVLVAGLQPVLCQQPDPAAQAAALHAILVHQQSSLWDYEANVPNLFAEEHVVSTLKQKGARDMKRTTDSTFRLVRVHAPGESTTFSESREIRLVNKKPVQGGDLGGPAIFSGAFSAGVGVVSLEMSRCFDYTMEPTAMLGGTSAVVIDYAIKADAENDCPGPESRSGRAWFDAQSDQLLRIEMSVPHHWDESSHTRSLWTWSVDYAPVNFESRTFWMPKTITSKAEANDTAATWMFTASYSNYHRLTVTSRIIADVGDDAPR
ncbi:MAG: hypothetical protein PW789_09370 [Edaphobacter sp.]|uniref:hypothetical protein n=1 Tax=Edaphobacter sp. TaxID=1934404 RepID=UPI002383A6F1|nr:hypothetical protein [Edaphobacter sp.]MDE1176804.1 hypothetical protein [Edaphobacter sp.]